ncbi:MAG: ATP phosphoribosyltransferase regulatory subunit [Halofilum sp. (in: g-proteobacteria)]
MTVNPPGTRNGPGRRWLLPEGIEEALPHAAARLERLRRRLLDVYSRWGYELVIPPLIEYLDSLLIGAGHDLELDTFKLVDQRSGRMMGLRADMTPQVARVDAHRLARPVPTRLCYVGSVVHTRPGPFGGGRSPLQVGAELYGHGGLAADVEVVELLLTTLEEARVPGPLCLDLGHVGIVRGLAAHCGIGEADEAALFEMLQRKSTPELDAYIDRLGLDAASDAMWRALIDLHGDRTVLPRAREALAAAGADVLEAIAYLERIGDRLAEQHPELQLHFDLAELRGYHYHTGVVFAVFVPGEGEELARGGRYDGIGEAFGRARPATGFSTDLRRLVALGSEALPPGPGPIAAPAEDDPALTARISELRSAGERVIAMLPGQEGGPSELGCDRQLVRRGDDWTVEEI